MTDVLKVIRRWVAYGMVMLAALGVGLKLADWMGHDLNSVSASASVPEQLAEGEDTYTRRAIAEHKIPPGSPRAICDTRDRLIGYWTYDKSVVIFDDEHEATQADCW